MPAEDQNKSQSELFDNQRFEDLYKRYYPRLFNFSFQFTKNKNLSQDMVHEVFLKYWENRHQIEESTVESLLFKMTRNMCLNHVKHIRIVQNKHLELEKTGHWEELYRIEFVKDEPYLLIEKELQESILAVLNDLPEKCGEVFHLSRVKGLKNKEISEKLGISIKAVEKHIHKALKEFRNKLPVIIPVAVIILVISNQTFT